MAVFPCDWSGHRYPQAQQSLYVTRVLGQESETWKLRFCPRHFDEAYSILRERTTEVDDTTPPQVTASCARTSRRFRTTSRSTRCGQKLCSALWTRAPLARRSSSMTCTLPTGGS
jgi:hypothetical protein